MHLNQVLKHVHIERYANSDIESRKFAYKIAWSDDYALPDFTTKENKTNNNNNNNAKIYDLVLLHPIYFLGTLFIGTCHVQDMSCHLAPSTPTHVMLPY